MANEQNLRPIRSGDLTKEELKKRQSNGGKKSAEARKEKKLFREAIEARIGVKIDDVVDAMFSAAIEDRNVKAATWLRDTAGQKPIETIEIKAGQEALIEEIEKYAAEIGEDEMVKYSTAEPSTDS